MSPVSFSHNNVRLIVLTESLLTVRLAVSEIKPVQSLTDRRTDRRTDGQTDGRTDGRTATDGQTELSTTVTLAAHAREG